MDEREAQRLLTLAHERRTEDWYDRLEAERHRIRAAVETLLEAGDKPRALELCAAVWPFWMNRGHADEGRQLLTAALAGAGSDSAPLQRAEALRGAGTLAFRQGDNDAAESLFEDYVALAGEAGDTRLVCLGLADLARVAFRRGDFATVRARSEEGIALARDLGDKEAERNPLHMLAATARMEGDLARARELYWESITLLRVLGREDSVAGELHNLGFVELHSDDVARAKELFTESLAWSWEHSQMYLLPYSLADFGIVSLIEGDLFRAAKLLAASAALFERTGAVPDPDDAVEIDDACAELRRRLDESAFTESWDVGRKLSLEDAVALALER